MKTTLDDNTRLILLQNFCVFYARTLKTAHTRMANQQMHIYKYVQLHIMNL